MAGKKQHFIPQALIKGFSSNGTQVFQYRKNNPEPIVSAIKNVAAERCFYGEEDCLTDTKITNYESRSSKLLHRLQSGNLPDDNKEIADFVYIHLVRTRNIRLSIDGTVKQVQKVFSNNITPKQFIAELKKKLRREPYFLLKSIRSDCAKKGIPLTPELEQYFLNYTLNNLDTLFKITKTEEGIARAIQLFPEMNMEIAKNTQAKVIPETIDSINNNTNKLRDSLSNFEWEILTFDENIILGDSAVIAGESLKRFALPIEKADKIKFIFMPITSTSVLFGKLDFPQKIQAKQFNHMSASISQEFFISSRKVSKKLSIKIGLKSGFKPNFDMDKYRRNFKL